MAANAQALLTALYDALGAGLTLYARQWLTDEEAENVVQEVFLRLLSDLPPMRNPRAWLYRAVRNAALNYRSAAVRRRRHQAQHAADRPQWFAASAGDRLKALVVQEAMQALPADAREVLVLRAWAGMTLQEIAEVTDLSPSTVHERYAGAVTALRRALAGA